MDFNPRLFKDSGINIDIYPRIHKQMYVWVCICIHKHVLYVCEK